VAIGDRNGQSVTGPGAGAIPQVEVFNAQTETLTDAFSAYGLTFTDGFNAQTCGSIDSFLAFDPNFTGGVSVALLSDASAAPEPNSAMYVAAGCAILFCLRTLVRMATAGGD
jgi:hypothetical protein